jgi:hypothetical protein
MRAEALGRFGTLPHGQTAEPPCIQHRHLGAAIASSLDNGLVHAAAISLNHLCLGHDID